MKVTKYELQDLGVDHAQYFQGAGTAFTDWSECFVGVGESARNAAEDAITQACIALDSDTALLQAIPDSELEGFSAEPDAHNDCHLDCSHGPDDDCPDHEECEMQHYAVIYIKEVIG